MNAENRTRVIVALNESAPIETLWRVTTRWLKSPGMELMTLYLADDRWQRAASLPFTREISRTGGETATFTMRRAQQVHDAAVRRIRDRMQQLAEDAKIPLVFQILPASEQGRLREIVAERASVVIAPSPIAREPVFMHLSQVDCRIEIVDEADPVDD